VSGNQAIREEITTRQIFRREQAALALHGRDFTPDLVEMHRGQHVKALLQRAQISQQGG
jgi:hypothetical protein